MHAEVELESTGATPRSTFDRAGDNVIKQHGQDLYIYSSCTIVLQISPAVVYYNIQYTY